MGGACQCCFQDGFSFRHERIDAHRPPITEIAESIGEGINSALKAQLNNS